MIQRNPEERMLCEARRKAEHDRVSELQAAEARGEARGKAAGEALGKIRMLQSLLELPEISDAEFDSMNEDSKNTAITALQKKLRDRA